MAENWHVGRKGVQSGPFTSAQIHEMAARGQLTPGDMLWKEGMPAWVAASSVAGLFATPSAPRATDNPYAPPAATDPWSMTPSAGGPARGMEYADYMLRVAAALLDGIFLFFMGCIPGAGLTFVAVVLTGDDAQAQQGAVAVANMCSQLVGLAIGVTYYVVLETSAKQGTWGKQIVGIKVTDLEGNRITVGRALGRYFAKILSGCTLGIGWLMPLFTDRKQTLHDMIAGCLALKK